MKHGARHVYMDDLAGAAGGGAGVDPGTVATGGAPGAAADQSGGAANAGAGASGSGDHGGASALSGGNEWSLQSVPEKYRVVGDDGQVDVQATLRKVEEGRSALEKRMGEGGARPKTPDEYKLPESDAFKALALDDASTAAFRKEAHDMGLSQQQYEGVMSKWATLAPQLVAGAQAETVDGAVASLRDTWKGDYDANIKESFRVVSSVAQSAGIPFAEVEKAIGNNPVAIRLFAALGPQMREDATPAAANGATGAGLQTRAEYVAENFAAYSNPSDPKHAAVTARAKLLADRESKGSPPL